MTLKDIIQKLENKWIAGITCLLILIIFYNWKNNLWNSIFTILLAYLIADVIKSMLIIGEKGIIQFPFLGTTQTQPGGHGYIIFLVYIVIGTLVSSWVGDYITKNFVNNLIGWQSWLVSNLIIIGLVYVDFYVTFKKR